MSLEQLSSLAATFAARLTGAALLKQDARNRFFSEQIRHIIAMLPGVAMGAAGLSLPLLAITAFGPSGISMMIWSACLYGMIGIAVLVWMRGRTEQAGSFFPGLPTIRLIALSAAMSLLLGIAPTLLFPAEVPAVRLMGVAATVGILSAAGLAIAKLPLVGALMIVPVLAGALLGLFQVENTVEALAVGALLVGVAAGSALLGLSAAQNSVRRHLADAQLREQKDVISLLLKEFGVNPADWLWRFDVDGRIEDVSDRFVAAAERSQERLAGHDFCAFLRSASSENDAVVREIEHDIAHREIFHDIVVKLDRDGGEHWWRLTGKPVFDEMGGYEGYIGTASDITVERLAERRINFLAHNDALTGLLNRGKFTDHLRQAVARLERYGSPFTVLYLDLDQFKSVNDSRGHLVGDKLLTEVGKRITSMIRETDVAARLGGDEFAIILGTDCGTVEAAALAGRLVEVVSKPYEIDDYIVSIGVSIGVAMAPVNGKRPDQILRNADLALYRAKAEGRGVFRFFESQMDSNVRERRMLELELRQAIKDGEFVLHYQPLVSANDHRTNGFEALVRWNHPIRGVVPPSEFIPIAEQTGLIMDIGDWTIREACLAAARWPEDLLVAVNLSAKHFQMSDITEVVREALAASGLSPHRLELEITESLLIQNPQEVIAKLAEVKALGVTIAMDDFGTGYSSLSYLLKFPFDKIKIDKSFVTASSDDMAARDILRTIASLGKTLKIRITAEGVETLEQVEFLREIACNQLQGFYFAKPLNEIDLASYFLNQFDPAKWNGNRPAPDAAALRIAG